MSDGVKTDGDDQPISGSAEASENAPAQPLPAEGRSTLPVDGPRRTPPRRLRLPPGFWIGLAIGLLLCWFALADKVKWGNWLAFFVVLGATACFMIFVLEALFGARRSQRTLKRNLFYFLLALIGGWSIWKLHSAAWGHLHLQPISKLFDVVCNLIVFILSVLLWIRLRNREGWETLERRVASFFIGVLAAFFLVVVIVGGFAWYHQYQTDSGAGTGAITAIESGTYVALGDSYSAGEGLTPFLPGSTPGCSRSPSAYPFLLRFEANLDPAEPNVRTVFRACAGAVTSDVDEGIVGGAAAQMLGTEENVSLVTITIGGNDVTFANVIVACILYDDCISERYNARARKSPARPSIDYPPDPKDELSFKGWATKTVDEYLVPDLDRVFQALKKRYPAARILVIGYPYLFPARDAPPPFSEPDCFTVLERVDRDERKELRTLGKHLNEVLYDRAYAHGLEFVSPEQIWDGHEPCASGEWYTNAVIPVLKLRPVSSATFHPTRKGQQALAELVTCYLNSTDKPEPRPDGSFAKRPEGAPGSLGSGGNCSPSRVDPK